MITPVDPTATPFEPALLLKALVDGGVDFVVIGGIAALLHGDDAATSDTDTTVRATPANLQALVDVITALEGRLLVPVNERQEATVDVAVTAETFSALTSARFLTRYGVLDVVLQPDGIADYQRWRQAATIVHIEGVGVAVAALGDVIASKEAAGREKDRNALPRLRALRRMIDELDR